jgi:tetratricopeptide (TPR) repeat protein
LIVALLILLGSVMCVWLMAVRHWRLEAENRADEGWRLYQLGRYDDAIAAFRFVVEGGGFLVAVHEQLAEPHQASDRRGRVQWLIAVSYLARGDYAKALTEFRLAREKHPIFYFDCGNQEAQHRATEYFAEALCLEHLGRYDEAARVYLRSAMGPYRRPPNHPEDFAARVKALYGAAGQLRDLDAIVELAEREYHRSEGFRGEWNSPARGFRAPDRGYEGWLPPGLDCPGIRFPPIPRGLLLPTSR